MYCVFFSAISRDMPACSLNFCHSCSSFYCYFSTWLSWCLSNGFCM